MGLALCGGLLIRAVIRTNYPLTAHRLCGYVPALLDQAASGSIHFTDFMMLASKPNHARNGRPHLTTSPPREINQVRSLGFARG